jgi:hypothetical protein
VGRGATEDLVAKLADYEGSDLPERTKTALRLADRLTGDTPAIDDVFHDELRRHFSDEQILDLGMTITFASGWQRFIEAFGIVPDRWHDGAPSPFHALESNDAGLDSTPPVPRAFGTPGQYDDNGVDLSLIRANMSVTPTERARRAERARVAALRVQKIGRLARAKPA